VKARIRRDARRYSAWQQVFGTDTIAIIEPPKDGPQGLRMLVDVAALSSAQRSRLAAKLSQTMRIPSDRVLKEMLSSGSVPISAEDVDVRDEARLF
jgi:hypothetical protein